MATLRQSLYRQAPDVAGFADYLTQIFGAPMRGLATVIRATPEYKAWRSTVEWCAVCRAYAPIRRDRVRGVVFEHHQAASGRLCSNSHAVTRWAGDAENVDETVRRDHLLRLLGVDVNNSEPSKEEVQA